MEKYKLTSEMKSEMSEFGKYEQYIDLEKCYEQIDTSDFLDLGLGEVGDQPITAVPGITVIAGMTGHGKSMLGNSIAYRGVKAGKNVLYITLEISKEDILYQMLSIHSFMTDYKAIEHSKIKKRCLSETDKRRLFDEVWPSFKKLDGNLHVLSEFDFDTTNSESMQRKMQEIEDYSIAGTGRGIDMVIVDYIQLFNDYSGKNISSEYSIINEWVTDFRKLSLNYLGTGREIPIIMLSQLNREAWSEVHSFRKKYLAGKGDNANIVISISQIAGSVKIVKDAAQVIIIYSDESTKAGNQCVWYMLKNRNGETQERGLVTYMNPKYYYVGKDKTVSVYNGTMDDLLSLDDGKTLDLTKAFSNENCECDLDFDSLSNYLL